MNVLLGVTGGIAAYKAADIIGGLKQYDCNIKVIMTEKAKSFITPLTLSTLSRNPIYDDSIEWSANGCIEHIDLANWADILLVAPATANTIAKFGQGTADNLLSSVYLAFDFNKVIVVCPTMNTRMLNKNIEYVEKLRLRMNHHIVNPVEGLLACGATGNGKLAPTRTIVEKVIEVGKMNESLFCRK